MAVAAASYLAFPIPTFLCALFSSLAVPLSHAKFLFLRAAAFRPRKLAEEYCSGFTADTQLAECAVCLCSLREGNDTPRLRCGHLFHAPCLHRWVESQRSTCPLCRAYLPQPKQSAGETLVVVAPFSLSDVEDTERWWLR